MNTKKIIAVVICLIIFGSCKKEVVTADYNVIPLPQDISLSEGNPFILKSSTNIVYTSGDEKLKASAEFLSEYIEFSTGLKLKITDKAKDKNCIVLTTSLSHENKEAYELTVTANQINVNGASANGVFYGIQTLRKSLQPDWNDKEVSFAAVKIIDYPRFGYRGALLDVGRYFFSAEFVKRYIDILALHNINRLHWHLTEDQGWRVEINKRPKLVEVGSMRKETLVGHLRLDTPHKFDNTPHGGFYTQDEIRDIVKYAADRYITVIPEIDLPGHMLAALAAYPELGCTGGPYEVATKWGVFEDVLCAGKEDTFLFLEDVFSEIIELFPSEYIHVGGDECPKTRWKVCPHCQAKIKELNLKADKKHTAEDMLQSYFVGRVEKFLNSKGRKIIGWDEILQGGIAPNATVMSWRGMEGGIEAARQSHDVIMTPYKEVYIDYYQSEDKENEPLSIGGYIPVERVYKFEPVPQELNDKEKKHIIGTQVNLWTEYISKPDHIEYMLLPRLAAISEVQWGQADKKDYDLFLTRLQHLFKFYDKYGYNAARHVLPKADIKQ